MTNNKEINFNAYIASIKEEAKPWIIEVHKYITKKEPSIKLELIYGLPGYKIGGDYIILKINVQNLAIHVSSFDLVKKFSKDFEKANIGKGCIRISYKKYKNLEILKNLIDEMINDYQQIKPKK